MFLFLFLVLLFVSQGYEAKAITLHGKAIDFTAHHPSRRLSVDHTLVIVSRNSTVDPHVRIIDKNHFIVWSDTYTVLPGDKWIEYGASYKFHGQEAFPLLVKTATDDKIDGAEHIGPRLWRIPKPCPRWPTLDDVAADPDILWVDEYRSITRHSASAREIHSNRSAIPFLPQGAGITCVVADTGFDVSSASFYSPDFPMPTPGSQSLIPTNHPKVPWWVTAEPGITGWVGANGGHGTATASAFAGFNTGLTIGMATEAKIGMYSFSPNNNDSIIDLPTTAIPGTQTFFQFLAQAASIGGASCLSASWGTSGNGQYDSLAAEVDQFLYDVPTFVAIVSAGNTGKLPGLGRMPSSPGLAKNVVSVGGIFSYADAYLTLWIDALNNAAKYGPWNVVDFSSYGPLPNGRTVPIVYSAAVYERVAYGYYTPVVDHTDFQLESGTSFSAPAIAGLQAGYQQSYKARNDGQNPLNALVIAFLLAHSQPVIQRVSLSSLSGAGAILYSFLSSYLYGYPVVEWIGQEVSGTMSSTAVPLSYCFSVGDGGVSWGMRIALGFTDFPSIAYSNVDLINDLDMLVYVNGAPTLNANNHVNAHELVKVPFALNQGDTVRVVITEPSGRIYKNLPWGLYLAAPNLVADTNCGTCLPNARTTCASGDSGAVTSYCNSSSGMMSACLPSRNPNISWPLATTCNTPMFQGTHVNGVCTVAQCNSGYYYDVASGTCMCVVGTQIGSLMCTMNSELIAESTIMSSPSPSFAIDTDIPLAGWLIFFAFVVMWIIV